MDLILVVSFLSVSFNLITTSMIPPRWSYELIDLTTYSSNPDAIEMDIKIERIGRGSFGYSGFMDFNMDLDESVIVLATLKRSKDKDGPFKDMPMKVDNVTLPVAMNKYYKPMMMDSIEKCCQNAPIFDEFTPPLTKRRVVIDKCVINTDALPNVMMEGYYILRISMFGETFNGYTEAFAYIENKKY